MESESPCENLLKLYCEGIKVNQNFCISYRLLCVDDFNSNILTDFKRYQETNRVWFQDSDQYKVKDDDFVDDWDDNKKEQVNRALVSCVKSNGAVIGAFLHDALIGFASVENELFGRKKEYLELSYIHVSNEYRSRGIGKKLFELSCEKAKKMGAQKLYIAAHPSVKTQQFYQYENCIYAVEISNRIYEKEPLDIQLEVSLLKGLEHEL